MPESLLTLESRTMRTLLLSLCCALLSAGVVLSGEVTLLKFDGEKKEVTVKEGERERIYKLTDKTTVLFINDKDGSTKKGTVDAAAKVLGNEHFKGKQFEISTSQDSITEMKLKAKRGKN